MEQAQRLDPLEVMINGDLAWIYYMARQYDRSLDQGRKTLELDNVVWVQWMMGSIYSLKSMDKEALEHYRNALIAAGTQPEKLRTYTDVMSFYRGYAERVEKSSNNPPPAYIYALLGENDKAIAQLEKQYESREGLLWIKVWPDFDNLRSDPRFQDLLRRLRLET